jgi:hypothetical protein
MAIGQPCSAVGLWGCGNGCVAAGDFLPHMVLGGWTRAVMGDHCLFVPFHLQIRPDSPSPWPLVTDLAAWEVAPCRWLPPHVAVHGSGDVRCVALVR